MFTSNYIFLIMKQMVGLHLVWYLLHYLSFIIHPLTSIGLARPASILDSCGFHRSSIQIVGVLATFSQIVLNLLTRAYTNELYFYRNHKSSRQTDKFEVKNRRPAAGDCQSASTPSSLVFNYFFFFYIYGEVRLGRRYLSSLKTSRKINDSIGIFI